MTIDAHSHYMPPEVAASLKNKAARNAAGAPNAEAPAGNGTNVNVPHVNGSNVNEPSG